MTDTKYTINRQGSSKAYTTENIQVTIYKEHYPAIATVKIASMIYSSVEISRKDAASMLLKIRKASQK